MASISCGLQPLGEAVIRVVLRSLCLGLLLLAGCVTSKAPERWASLPDAQKGLMFGTITAEMSAFYTLTHYQLLYRNVSTGETGLLSLSPRNRRMPPGIGDEGDPELREPRKTIGRLFEVALPAGDYEFFEVRFWSIEGTGGSWRSDPEFSLPFTVAAGGIHYVGEFRGYPIVGKHPLFGYHVPAGGYFVILDAAARDTALLAKRRAAQSGAAPLPDVVNIVPDPERAGTEYLRRAPMPPFQTVTN